MTLLDRLCNPDTRRGALERCLIAHVVLDPSVIKRLRRATRARGAVLYLSPAACVVLDLILESPQSARAALLGFVFGELRVARHCSHHVSEPKWMHVLQCEKAARYRDVVRLARDVETLTIQDVTSIGTPLQVVALIDSLDDSRATT